MRLEQEKEQEQPLVSVIIPVYNTAPYLRRCLDSVTGQTYRNLEIILIDDGSTDESAGIMEAYAGRDERIRMLHQENGGQSSARNAGLDIASGEWIVFVDSDDRVSADMVEILLAAVMREDAQIGVGAYWRFDESGGTQFLKHVVAGTYTGQEAFKQIFCRDGFTTVWSAVFKADIFEKHRFVEGRIYEDTLLIAQALCSAGASVCVDVPVYFYHQRQDGSARGSEIHKIFHDRFWVWKEVERYIEKEAPGCAGQMRVYLFWAYCVFLYQIEQLGRKCFPDAWKQAVSAFSDIKKKKRPKDWQQRVVSLLFDISPVLLVKIHKLYFMLIGGEKPWLL